MKNKYTKLNTILLVFLLGYLFSFTDSSSYRITAEVSISSPLIPTLQAYTDHGPINIEYDENFTDYGFPGAGTPGDPYRIEDYNITITSDYPIVFGGYTSKYFVIQNCFLKSDTNIGIYLGKYYNMADGTVKILDNVIISDRIGIEMNGGKNSLISGNTITGADGGMAIYDSSGFSTISNNIISTVDETGIYLENSSNITVTRNNCVGNWVGISLNNMVDAILTHNNCSENDLGIELTNTLNNITLTNNIFIQNTDTGILVATTDNSLITNNLFQENINYAIRIHSGSDNNIIHHNAFINNNDPGVQASDDGTNNFWYDASINEGNYWAWLNGTIVTTTYSIDGSASSVDLYPLGSMPVIPEFSSLSLVILLASCILAIPVINFAFRRKKR